jgi:glycosyltransferase involved in cell wall biosynthesis
MKRTPIALGIFLIIIATLIVLYRKPLAPKLAAGGEKGHIVWIMHSYLPNVRAGSEITAHALNRYLSAQGWRISVLVNSYVTDRHEGIDIYSLSSPEAPAIMESATILACQNFNGYSGIEFAEKYSKPILFFLHVEFEKIDILQQRFKVPVYVVYNSTTQRHALPTIHQWTTVRPHIDYDRFRSVKVDPAARNITLLNCNTNKGGEVLQQLAKELPEYPFLGIKGAYQTQLIYDDIPNLKYEPTFEDPRQVYQKSRIVIMPSRSESWGRVALEAMAAGIPVIVGGTPGLRECTAGAAPVCNQTNTECWVKNIKELYEDSPARRAAIEAGLARIAELAAAPDFQLFDEWLAAAVL